MSAPSGIHRRIAYVTGAQKTTMTSNSTKGRKIIASATVIGQPPKGQ